MSIDFSIFSNNVSVWIDREYDKFEKDFEKKSELEYDKLIQLEQININNYIQSVIDEIQFEIRRDLKGKFDYAEVRDLYEKYQTMIKPHKFSLMEYKVEATKKEPAMARIHSSQETRTKVQFQSMNRKKNQNKLVGASVGGVVGAGIGLKAFNPIMLKLITTPAGLFVGAVIGGYAAVKLLPINQSNKQANRIQTVQRPSVGPVYQETASTDEYSRKVKLINTMIRERKQLVEQKLIETIYHMEQNYDQLLASAKM